VPPPTYATVTELPGSGATGEQIAMLHTRYQLAGDLAEGQDVLEVACGPGIGLGYLAERARRVVGGDCDAHLVAIARHQYHGTVEIHQLTADQLPFAAHSFDVVLLLEAIYYLPDAEAFVREARRVLRPGGTLLIASANCERADFNSSPFSQKYFSARELGELLRRGGFTVRLLAGFPTWEQTRADRFRGMCRRAALRLHLIPRTMKWKARLKRLFFGKLQQMPHVLAGHLYAATELTEIESHDKVDSFKVIYALGTAAAQEQRQAA
jgi:SAM-dependent methyltransferase